nr:polysulfide reductase [Gammaproteobacteria bacterium]NIO61325.1 polysulfide reductase [Gammaproteobacteria bacterium]
LIVIYPYITGLVAGAFIVSSLYHVFGINSLKPVARLSLITALAFLLVCPLPLIIHLGRPERALEMFLRPNLLSAMAGFGYIWFMYLILLLVETWLVFRPDIVAYANSSEGIKQKIYSLLSLGIQEISEKSRSIDNKVIRVLAIIGIPAACLLHGYVGFIFGAVKSNAWWSTSLMPIIFLVSAIVSGIALLLVIYVVATKIRKATLDHGCVHSLALWLGGFITLALALEGLEVLTMAYESEESWGLIQQLITKEIGLSYFGIQFALGTILPILVMGTAEIVSLNERTKTLLRFASAAFILLGVFAMRWNVVIGGQLLSKSLRGFTSYVPPLWGEAGILVAVVIFLLPFLIIFLISNLLQPWQAEAQPSGVNRMGLRARF